MPSNAERKEDPYGKYRAEYMKRRTGIQESQEEVEDALIAAMGRPSQDVAGPLQPLHNFVRQSLERGGIPLNWVFQAEHDVREEGQIQKYVAQLGEALSAKVTIQTDGGRGLGKNRSERLRRGIGHMVATEVITGLGPAGVDFREHHISSITAEVMENPDGTYTVAFTVEGEHPQLGLPLSAHGTARMQIV